MPETTILRLSDVALQSNRRIALDSRAFARIDEFRIPGKSSSVPEAEAPFPICPQAEPTDTVIYRDGKDPSKTFFLQRYRLRDSQGRYEIAIKLEPDSLWSMKFGLAPYPAPEVAETARTSQPLPHKTAWSLRYVMAGTAMEKEFQAFAVTPDPNGMVIEFRLTLAERDAVLRAFAKDESQARLVVIRQIDVCIPAPPEPVRDSPPPIPSNLVVQGRKTVALDTATIQPLIFSPNMRRVQP
ncbi:MAG: hypothetical protein OEW13_00085 [Nitrospira sp.]|nr:hypothetical protein [Nitrospira sp.]